MKEQKGEYYYFNKDRNEFIKFHFETSSDSVKLKNGENLENVLNNLKFLQESNSKFFLFSTKEETNNLNFNSGDKIFVINDSSSKNAGWAFYININDNLVLISEKFNSEISAFFTEEKFELLNLLKKEDFMAIEYFKSLDLSILNDLTIKDEKICFKGNELITKLEINEILDNDVFWKNANISNKLEKNGYMILPNGLVMQWGREIIYDTEQDLEFAIKFKEVYTVQVTIIDMQEAKVSIKYLKNDYITVCFNNNVSGEVLWFAMGKI